MEGGRSSDVISHTSNISEHAGIIPRSIKQVFDHLRSLTDEHSVRVSHLELYNEQLTDLLSPEDTELRVYEDPRIDAVEEMLPGSNCGACSMPGCRAFAEKIVAGEMKVSKCSVSSPSGIEAIAQYLGVEAGSEEKKVARLLCAGGKAEAHNRALYRF